MNLSGLLGGSIEGEGNNVSMCIRVTGCHWWHGTMVGLSVYQGVRYRLSGTGVVESGADRRSGGGMAV